MKKSIIRIFILALGVTMLAGFGPGIVSSPFIVTATGNNIFDDPDTDPLNPITSDDIVVSVDWSAVSSDISAVLTTDNDRNVRVLAGTQYTIPTDILSTLVQNKKVLMLHAGNDIVVSVSSEDVKMGTAMKINMSRSLDIPDEAYHNVSNVAKTFAVKEDSLIPFKADVHVTVGEEYAGKYAVLYRYHASSNSLVASGSFVVTEGGNAMFALHGSGEYVVAIAEELPQITTTHVVTSGDALSKIARRYEIRLNALLQANPQITDANMIRIGQKLIVW